MPRKKPLVGILLLLALTISIAVVSQANLALAAEPAKLKIYTGPTSVPADNNIYESLFVQLQDSSSRPARAAEDTTISLSSSQTSVGTIDPTITITKGNTYAIAKFKSTFTPGSTTIAATASGYATVQVTMNTIAPVPAKLALYGFPPVLPADGASYEALVVQLQDSSGSPAKAPLENVIVTLFSSNDEVASVTTAVTIIGGQTYAVADITSTAPGTATITAMASGYASTQTTITSQTPAAAVPQSLRIYSVPPRTLADNTERPQIVVQLLNAGKITQLSAASLLIQLSSSNQNVGNIQPTLEIPAGKTHATATFYSTYQAGSTTITAAATNLASDTETVTTIGPIPSKLAVYCNPSTLPADNKQYNTIQVQLQDSSGRPALDPDGDVTVSLFSSEPTVGTVAETLTIPYGQTYATTTFASTYLPSSTTITAQASGYTTGQATMRTYIIDQSSLDIVLTADPTTVTSGKQTNITAYVTDPGTNPTTGATVKFTSSSGGTFTTVKAIEAGYYTAMLTAPNFNTPTNVTITATVSKTDYTTSTATIQLNVSPIIKTANMQLLVKDDAEQPLDNVTIASIKLPAGMTTLAGTTNSTGYIVFPNAMEGNYTFSLDKQGYDPMNATINFKATSTTRTLYMTRASDNQPAGTDTYVWLIPCAVIVGIVIAVVVLMQRRRVGVGV